MTVEVDAALALKELAADCADDPLGFAQGFWPDATLRSWQESILTYIGERLRTPETRYRPIRVAVASGNGIGKSALIGMVLTWAMSTCSGCRCKVTAGKAEQLETKTVPEVTSWFKKSLGAHWFDYRAKSIKSMETDAPESWRIDFETWTEEKPDTFQGLHNVGKRMVMVFDEGSTIADVIYDAAETSLTDENTELIFIVFGNPVRNSGRFRELFGRFKHLWRTQQIDSRTVEGVSRSQADEWVESYGEDSDFVRTKVRGEFPRAGSNQLISSDVVSAARKYKAVGYDGLPKIMAIDVARFGDDQTVIGKRQGRYSAILSKHRGLDTVQVAERAIEWIIKEQPDAVVVDGDGLGAGVVDQIRVRGYGQKLFEFHGGATASDPQKYFNKIAECWGLMRDWLDNAQIPDDPELASQLESREYGFSNKGQIQLEKKADLKARGLDSPDLADQLAMSFGVQVNIPRKEPKEERFGGRDAEFGWMAS